MYLAVTENRARTKCDRFRKGTGMVFMWKVGLSEMVCDQMIEVLHPLRNSRKEQPNNLGQHSLLLFVLWLLGVAQAGSFGLLPLLVIFFFFSLAVREFFLKTRLASNSRYLQVCVTAAQLPILFF